MKSNPAEYDLVAPGSLQAVVSLLAKEPGKWLPIAGGTDVMVQYAAGKLSSRKLVSIWNLPELRGIAVLNHEIQIGSGCTYTNLREHRTLTAEFPLLASAARWTGSVANQNRGTLGGNIVNASPAADSLPALLVYEAELIVVSAHGERRIPYRNFHTGYKKMQLQNDELIRAVCLPRRFSEYFSHARKVGARNAQAIAKVCIAALGQFDGTTVGDVRIALGSVAPVPIRLSKTEQLINGKPIDRPLIISAKEMAVGEIEPIDDIRSTAAYRAAVAGNLVAEFLEKLHASGNIIRNEVLERWNHLAPDQAANDILPCCGSTAWAHGMASRRPVPEETALLNASDEIWRNLAESDWTEAFRSHPRIGESKAELPVTGLAANWSAAEQRHVSEADDAVKMALTKANREYEQRFGQIFIVCATRKSPAEILQILRRRMQNDRSTEFHEAAEQQRQITHIRLQKWLKG
jgi:OHCU decarboxylase